LSAPARAKHIWSSNIRKIDKLSHKTGRAFLGARAHLIQKGAQAYGRLCIEVPRRMKLCNSIWPMRIVAVAALICFSASLGALGQKKTATPTTASVFAQDKGKFNIQLEGRTVGHEEFEIAPSGAGWAARSTTDIKPPDSAATRVTGNLTLQSDGAPISYEWTAQGEKTNGAHIIFVNGIAKITLEMQGARPFEQHMDFRTPRIAVLDDNVYYQYAILARIYDWSKGGAQTLPVLIPQELTPGSITVESTGSAPLNGKTYEGLRAATSDLEVLLYLDGNHRLMRLEVPSAKVSVVRE
jgi:hypothetical protein